MSVRKDRNGAEEDEKRVQSILKKMGYRTQLKEDPTAEAMKNMLTAIQKNKSEEYIKRGDDSFICCIMSHGGKDEKGKEYIAGSDGGKFYLQEEAYNKLNAGECSALHGKPKIFFVQACRGNESENMVETPTDSIKPCLVTHSDFLFCFATVPHGVAYRPKKGSIFFTILCENLDKYYEKMDVTTIVSHICPLHFTSH